MEKDEGEFVESGAFRVDRERMLEVLSRYQLKQPGQFFDAWARCAVASGASEIRLEPVYGGTGHGFEMSFDGRPFTREELSDPYAALCSGQKDRNAFLAAGLLALFRTGPLSITVSSGEAGLTLKGILDHASSAASGSGLNVLRVRWGTEPKELTFDIITERVDQYLPLCPIPLRYSGRVRRPLTERNSGSGAYFFDEGGRRGFLTPLEQEVTPLTGFHPEQDSRIGIHTLGVRVETSSQRLPLVPVNAEINDDALNLDASLGACVRDERFEEMLTFLQKQAATLLLREIEAQKKDLGEVGSRLHIPVFVRLWRARMKWEEAWTSATSGSGWVPPPFLRRLFRPRPGTPREGYKFYSTGSRAWWLQDACRRTLTGRHAVPDDPVLRALWEAPVLLSAHRGALLSLDSIHRRLANGRLAVTKRVVAEDAGIPDAVWLASFRDERFLNEWIPEDQWDLV